MARLAGVATSSRRRSMLKLAPTAMAMRRMSGDTSKFQYGPAACGNVSRRPFRFAKTMTLSSSDAPPATSSRPRVPNSTGGATPSAIDTGGPVSLTDRVSIGATIKSRNGAVAFTPTGSHARVVAEDARVDEAEDMRMLKRCGYSDLLEKSVGTE